MATIWSSKNKKTDLGLCNLETACFHIWTVDSKDKALDPLRSFAELAQWKVDKADVIIGTFGNGGDDISFDSYWKNDWNLKVDGDNVLHFDGDKKDEFSMWEVTFEGGLSSKDETGKCRFQSKKTGKYLRIKEDGSVDCGADKAGPWTLFKWHQGKGGFRFESDKMHGVFLHVGPEPDAFTQHYDYLDKATVVLRHGGGQNVKVSVTKDGYGARNNGEFNKFARFTAEPEAKGDECRFKSELSGTYLRIGPNGNFDVSGDNGPDSLFTVHKQGAGKVKLEAKKTEGKYVAFEGKYVSVGDGDDDNCLFEIFRKTVQ